MTSFDIKTRTEFRESQKPWRKLLERLTKLQKERRTHELTTQEMKYLVDFGKQTGVTGLDNQIAFLQHMLDEGDKSYREQLFQVARTDITAFSEWIEPDWVPARHHQYMLNKIENFLYGENQRLIISMPVGHAKTTYSSLITPAFGLGLNPMEKVFIAGHTQKFVENSITKKIRGIIQSDAYKQVFPETQIMKDSNMADYLSFHPTKGTNPGHLIGKGVGGGISGYRATRIVADDLYPNLEEANSPAWRSKVKEWWHGDMMARLLPGGNVILVCTRWHGDDLIGNLLDSMKEGSGQHFDTVIFSAICEDEENDPLGRKEGEALWPDFYTAEHLMKTKKSIPTRTWNCLYQSNPVDEAGGIVQSEWFRHWEVLPPENTVRRKWVSFDTANTATNRSDYTVGTAWWECMNNKYYLVDIVRQRVEYPELRKLVDQFARRNNASAILVEDAGSGKALVQEAQGKLFAPLIPISPYNKNKEFRFDEISPLFESGAVLLPKSHELLSETERELVEFPNGKKDDIVDSITHALRWCRGSNIKRGMKKIKGTY